MDALTRESVRRLSAFNKSGGTIETDIDLHCTRACLADEFLREHDETPVTEEWLRSLGFEPFSHNSNFMGLWGVGVRLVWDRDIGKMGMESNRGEPLNRAFQTRGEVRRLAELFGIELKEQE